MDNFQDDFWFSWKSQDAKSLVMKGDSFNHDPLDDDNKDTYAVVSVRSSLEQSFQTYYRINLTDFISNFGGLALSVMKAASFIFTGWHRFMLNKEMLGTLYGQADSKDLPERSKKPVDESEAKQAFKQTVESRQGFSISYMRYILAVISLNLMCCLKCCCRCTESSRAKRISEYEKFQIAVARLTHE